MTWYADEILIPASDEVIQYIAADPQLSPFTYVIPDLNDYPWYSPGHQHNLPAKGLVVIRPVKSAGDHAATWYGEPFIEWSALTNLQADSALLNSDVEKIHNPDSLPPQTFRRYLFALAQKLNTTVVYYSGAMWGGSIDYESVLAYSPRHESVFNTNPDFDSEHDSAESALCLGLAAIGISTAGFFAPHTRSFPWQDYAIKLNNG